MRIASVLFCICLLGGGVTVGQDADVSKGTRRIEGVVTDLFGAPWAGATLRLKSRGFIWRRGIRSDFERETKTDGEGRYSFDNLPEDSYEVSLLKMLEITLVETKETGVFSADKPYRLDFGVEVGAVTTCQYMLSGFVKDETEKPVVDAKVSLMSAFKPSLMRIATTNKDGYYSIDVCGLGDYIVIANTPKYEAQTTTAFFRTHSDWSKSVSFKLKPLSPERLNWRK